MGTLCVCEPRRRNARVEVVRRAEGLRFGEHHALVDEVQHVRVDGRVGRRDDRLHVERELDEAAILKASPQGVDLAKVRAEAVERRRLPQVGRHLTEHRVGGGRVVEVARLVKVLAQRLAHRPRQQLLMHETVEVVERLVVCGLRRVRVGGEVAERGEHVGPNERAEQHKERHQRRLAHRVLRRVKVGAARALRRESEQCERSSVRGASV